MKENPDPDRKRKRLAELEAMAREQDEDAARREISTAVAGQLYLLAARLRALGYLSDDEEPEARFVTDLQTGELITGIETEDGLLFAFDGAGLGAIVVRRKRRGRSEYTLLGDDGKPGPWTLAAPPESGSN